MESQDKDIRRKLSNYAKMINSEPRPEEVKINAAAGNTKYIPISDLEMKLDEMFFGLWQTDNFRWERMGNEIVGSIDLKVFHPTANMWIQRTGSAATMIRLKKGSEALDLANKLHNSLEMDFPHLKADCLRNACASLGKSFGRDLNRKYQDYYKSILKDEVVLGGGTTVESLAEHEMQNARYIYDNNMQRAKLEEEQSKWFQRQLQIASTPAQVYALSQKLEQFIPDTDPREQFKKNALHHG